MRQQFIESTGRLGWQALQHVAQIPVGFLTAELRGLYQTHDDGGALSGAQRARKKPVPALMHGPS